MRRSAREIRPAAESAVDDLAGDSFIVKVGVGGPSLGSGGYDVRMGRVLGRKAVWAPKITGMKRE